MDQKYLDELYLLVIQAIDKGIWDWDVPSGNAYFTPKYYEILGYQDKEFPATYEYWFGMVHPDDKERVEKELKEAVSSDKTFMIDVRLKTKDGSWLWSSTRGKAVTTDKDGKALRMVGTLTDISERKLVAEELETSRIKLQEQLDAAKKLNKLTVGRELKMVELKNRIKELEMQR